MANTILVSNASRYKDSAIYRSDFGPLFSLMEVPIEFATPTANEFLHTIRKGDIGFLDHLAVRYYGQGYEKYGWVIGLVNRLIDPDRDMVVGQRLRIPPRTLVLSFVSRIGRA